MARWVFDGSRKIGGNRAGVLPVLTKGLNIPMLLMSNFCFVFELPASSQTYSGVLPYAFIPARLLYFSHLVRRLVVLLVLLHLSCCR